MTLNITRRGFGASSLKLAVVSTAFAAGLPSGAWAQGFSYAGKTIEWVVPFSTGGGTDVWARFHAPFMTKYLPGNPNVVIRNVTGGGSITGANQYAANAKPDGLSLLGTSGSTQMVWTSPPTESLHAVSPGFNGGASQQRHRCAKVEVR